jgi:hypothetical protein
VEKVQPNEIPLAKHDSDKELGDMVHTFKILNDAKECSDHISRLAGICLSLNEDCGIQYEQDFSKECKNPIPWDNKLYKHKSSKNNYTVKDFPDWLPKNDESNSFLNKNSKDLR